MGIRRFRVKLMFILIILIGLSVLVSGIITASHLRKSRIESLNDSMLREISIIMATVPWQIEGSLEERIAYFSERASYLKQHIQQRVTFVSADGTVLGDSDEDELKMDNHLTRPEIQQALQTEVSGQASRYSQTVKAEMLVVAVPVFQDNELVGFVRLGMSLEKVKEQIFQLWSFLITGLIILFIVASIFCYRIAHSLTRPLENIMQVAGQITELNYEARVHMSSQDELGQLGKAINKMAMSLEQQMRRIQENENRLENVLENLIIGVIMVDQNGYISLINPSAKSMLGFTSEELHGRKYDKTNQHVELTKMIEEGLSKREMIRDEFVLYYPDERVIQVSLVPIYLQQNHADGGVLVVMHDITEVRRLERMRSEFVANVSHELKTPIASVKGFAETLLAGALDDPETARSFLQIIFDESGRLDRLVVDILELSKIESKRIPLNFSPVHLSTFTSKTLEMMNSEARKKNITLRMNVPDDLYLEADEDRLRQIVLNLLSNGINYTPEGGNVSIEAKAVNDHPDDMERIRITVSDTGIGIPKKDLPRVFERFYRVDKARSRRSGGTGLGLSIVKHLVELHKGTIDVESSQGLGTTFTIEIPVIH